MKIRNVFGNRYSGTLGKDVVAVHGKTTDYLREYQKPTNPNTERQQVDRGRFAQAVAAWQDLSDVQKEFYRRIEPPREGYHVFVGRAKESLGREEPIEVPVRMSWTVEGPLPAERSELIVRRKTRELFCEPLAATVEVALTPSDAPYTFFLRRGFPEDSVLTLGRPWPGEPPPVLESNLLGIRLLRSPTQEPQEPARMQEPPSPAPNP